MATRSHGVLINTAGLLYASLGFSLSVIAALFGVFNHFFNPLPARSFHMRHHLPRKLRGPRTVRSFSDQTRKVTVTKLLSPENENTDVKSLRRRSKSLVPIITIDHFGSVNPPNCPNLLRKPVLPAETLLPNHANTDDTLMDLPTMRRPTIRRHNSSPLVLPRAAFLPEPGAHWSSPVPSKKESKSSSIKMLRKTSSAADVNQESSCRIGCNKTSRTFDAFCLRKVGKKSPTLRTQPYGAPYFCTPPLPIPNSSLRTASPEHDTQTRL